LPVLGRRLAGKGHRVVVDGHGHPEAGIDAERRRMPSVKGASARESTGAGSRCASRRP
jgi:hypothetical protein